jgi:DNA-binding NtrC family response regulator
MDNLIIGVGGRCFQNKLERLQLQPGVSLRLFQRGGEALFCIEQCRPELIIVDYRLPDIDGLSFMFRVRRIAPDSQRILCGLDSATQSLAATTLNLFACVDAAVDADDLARIINRSRPAGYRRQALIADPGVWHACVADDRSQQSIIQ